MTKLDSDKLYMIIQRFIKDALDGEEEARVNRKRPYTDEDLEDRAFFLGSLAAEMKEAGAKCNYDPVKNDAERCIEDHGLDIKVRSDDYHRLCRELLKANMAWLWVEEKRVMGDYSDPVPQPDIYGLERIPVDDTARVIPFVPNNQTSDTLQRAVDDFWNEYNQDWKPRSKVD